MQHIWMLQMTRIRFQFCSDPAIIHVLSDSMAAYIQTIPKTRKNKPSVQYWLLDLAEKILLQDTGAAGIGKEQNWKVS